MLELGVISDDLTGGMKVASFLERESVRCPLVTSGDALETLDDEVQAVVVGRKLLAKPADEAQADARHAGETLLARGTRQLYQKYSGLFASTARGNIGPVAETLMDITGAGHVLFCPAFPERGSTVYQGWLFLGNGRMLHESPRRYDPVTPMTNSNLVEVLQSQSRVKVGLLDHDRLVAGTAACEEHLREQKAQGVRFFIADSIDPADMARVAALSRASPLVTGADQLPVMLARNWLQERNHASRTSLPGAPGHAAVISGSCTPKTGRQLAYFERAHPVFRVDLLEAAADPALADKVIDWARDRVTRGPLGVATTTDRDGVIRAHAELGREGASALADQVLATVSRALHEFGVRKFVVAGGETSGAVMESLGVDRVEVAAYDEVLYGGYCHSAGTDPLSLVLKAGGAGDNDFHLVALERMRSDDA